MTRTTDGVSPVRTGTHGRDARATKPILPPPGLPRRGEAKAGQIHSGLFGGSLRRSGVCHRRLGGATLSGTARHVRWAYLHQAIVRRRG